MGEQVMKTFFAVFTSPDPGTHVFWGAFQTKEQAQNAIQVFVDSRHGWFVDEFSIDELPFDSLL